MALTTDQTITLVKTITIFIENRDPFTVSNIINELKRDGDQLNGFYDDNGNCIVDEIRHEIADAIENIMFNVFPEFTPIEDIVYTIDATNKSIINYDDEDWDEVDDFSDEEFNTDKEGNRIPEEEKEEDRGAGWYKDPATGEWMWDRDAAASAEYEEEMKEDDDWDGDKAQTDFYNDKDYEDRSVPNNDHNPTYELTVDKNKRINIGKKILKNTGWKDDEAVVIVASNNGKEIWIVSANDENKWSLSDNEYVVDETRLNKGSLRFGVGSVIDNIQTGDVLECNIHYPVMCTEDNLMFVYIHLGE